MMVFIVGWDNQVFPSPVLHSTEIFSSTGPIIPLFGVSLSKGAQGQTH